MYCAWLSAPAVSSYRWIVVCGGKVAGHQARLMHADGILFDVHEWGDLLRFLFVEPGTMRRLIGPYLRYYKPGFHPTDIDTRQLLEDWLASDEKLAA